MKRVAQLLILILCFTQGVGASAASPQSLSEVCQPGYLKTYESDLYDLLTRYRSLDLRRGNQLEFIATLDRYIAKTQIGVDLLNCRQGLPFRVSFSEGYEMAVNSEYDSQGNLVDLNLNFGLSSSALTALFTYQHELRHICQKGQSQELWKQYYAKYNSLSAREKLYYSARKDAKQKGIPNSEFDELDGRIRRQNLMGEVDGFYFQLQQFTLTAQKSPAICGFSQAQDYLMMEQDYNDGIFAQVNLSSYVRNYANNDPQIFVVDSPLRSYLDQSTNQTFLMRTLHSEIQNFLIVNSIPYFLY